MLNIRIRDSIFLFRQRLKRTPIFWVVVFLRRMFRGYGELDTRVSKNIYNYSPSHDRINHLQASTGIQIFIETGTLIGDCLIGVQGSFRKLYSIELDWGIYQLAKRRLSSYSHIELFHGDSSTRLNEILDRLTEPAIFWLDAHYSAGVTALGEVQTPVMQELKVIFDHRIHGHYILVDDVKDFNGLNDYPTVHDLLEFVRSYGRGLYSGRVDGDIFFIEPTKK